MGAWPRENPISDLNKTTAAFEPINQPNAGTVGMTLVANTSQNIKLPTKQDGQPQDPPTQYAIFNAGATLAFVAFGNSGVTATAPNATTGAAGGVPVLPGIITVLSIPGNPAYMAAISTGTPAVYVTPGKGKL